MYTYLALGDSYTIGEQVAPEDNFPSQLVTQLEQNYNLAVAAPPIIAVTGWTTDELAAAIEEEQLKSAFDIVTLLIGVNNQYRGRDIDNYRAEFETLLQRVIVFANGRSSHVFVLSIPDWGTTPFAEGKDRQAIAAGIDLYNAANKEISATYQCNYLDITPSTRAHGHLDEYLTPDKLHYSAKEYGIWAQQLAVQVGQVLSGQ